MKTRILTAALLVTLLGITACASDTDGGSTTTAQETADTPAVTETAAETAEPLFTDTLKTEDFGGAEFRVYTTNELVGMTLPTTINYAEEETGEIVNDTLYARDRWMEETYNIDMICTVDVSGVSPRSLVNGVLAGDDVYDLIIHDLAQYTYTMSTSNCIYPLNYVDAINLQEEYWMPELNEQLKIGGNLFFSCSPVSPRFYGSVYIILFNRELAQSLDLEDMYSLVTEGNWTLDKMIEFSRAAVYDLDGNGKLDDNDRMGMFYEVLTPESMVMGAGYHYIENVGGTLTCMLEDTGLINLMQKMASFYQEDCVQYDGDPSYDTEKVLYAGNFLFYNPCTFNLADLRDLEFDYGILPMPKENAEQENYYGYSQPWASASPVIPITVTGDRLSMVGTLTDAMAAYGYDYVRPAVYENVIQLKGARDEKSAQIIDLMFDNITFELTTMLGFGKLNSTTKDYFISSLGKKEITSMYASIKDATEKEIEAVVSQYASFGDNLG